MSDRQDEPSAANRMAEAGKTTPPGHPAADDTAVPSAGEQVSRDAEDAGTAVPGDEVLLGAEGDADEPPTEHMPG